jgi:hypothetical protein
MMHYLGIDPGKSGGFAMIPEEGEPSLYKMPETVSGIWQLVHFLHREGIKIAVIERVHSMPGNGGKAMFTFGQNYGYLLMALTAAEIPFRDVTPQAWIKSYHMKKQKTETKSQWKRRLRGVAEQRWPSAVKKITNATADALLIAGYANDQHSGSHLEAPNGN